MTLLPIQSERVGRAMDAAGSAVVAISLGGEPEELSLPPGACEHEPITAQIQLSPGIAAIVRSADEVQIRRIFGLAGVTDDDDDPESDAWRAAWDLLARWAIVGAPGLTLFGEPVPFATEDHPTLGKLASLEVLDALLEIDGAEAKITDHAVSGWANLISLTRPDVRVTLNVHIEPAPDPELHDEANAIIRSRWGEVVALAQALLESPAFRPERMLTAGEVAAVLTAAEAGADWRRALAEHRAGQALG